MRPCPNCGGTAIEFDPAQGSSFCQNCGAVLEENVIVSEVTFEESASGDAVMQGQFVSDNRVGAAPPSMIGFGRRYPQTDSREWTLQVAKQRIASLASAVHLSERHADSAHRWYTLALQHNFTRGRKSQNIAAACLYIVCRQEKTSHILLDFSDILRTNVYELGNTFLRLCRLLNVDIPLIDPSLYIGRFASKLEFGDKTKMVADTALRLVARMKRDWIQIGRRPAGICGACLLISARLYGFHRTQKEIINVVRVCDLTLRKRLDEFSETPSSQLTPDEFHGIWLEQEADPPAFQKIKGTAQGIIKSESLPSKPLVPPKPTLTTTRTSTRTKKKIQPEIEHKDLNIATGQSLLSSDDSSSLLSGSPLSPETLLHIDQLTPSSLKFLQRLDEEDLSHMDDDAEIVEAFLKEDEVQLKTEVWMESNKDYLKAQEEKEKQKLLEEESGAVKPVKKRRRTHTVGSRKQMETEPAATAVDAAKQMLATKKFSKKFNYEALDSLLESKPIQNLAETIEQSTVDER